MHLIISHMNFNNKNKICVQGPPQSSHTTQKSINALTALPWKYLEPICMLCVELFSGLQRRTAYARSI